MDDEAPVEHTPDSPTNIADDEFRPFLIAPPAVAVRESPNGTAIHYSVCRANLEPVQKVKKKGADLKRFVLAGFDTEYQSIKPLYTHKEIVKGKQARYEVLSYQLFVKLEGHVL